MNKIMKALFLILILLVNTNLLAQGVVIEPAPLSVQDDGTRKIINRKEGDVAPAQRSKDVIEPPASEALVIPNDDVVNPPVLKIKPEPQVQSEKIAIEITPIVNPADGQLSLDELSNTNNLEATSHPHSMVSDDLFPNNEYYSLKKYLQFSFGYLNSRYKKIHPSLDNGSTMLSFKFVADMSSRIQSGFAIEVLSDKGAHTSPDNIRVLQYRVFLDYHAPFLSKGELKLDWIGGIGFSVGDFGIRRRYANDLGQEVSIKLKDGIIAGIIPTAGVRIYLFNQNSFDLMIEYHQYFTTPQRYIGGLAFAPRLSFEF